MELRKSKVLIYLIVLLLAVTAFMTAPDKAYAASVTQKTHTQTYSGDGGSSYAFTTSNGLVGACCQHGPLPAPNGRALSLTKLSNSGRMARVAYICYRDYWDTSKEKYSSARALWVANGGSIYDCAANCQSTVRSILSKADNLSAAPAWFVAYKCNPSGGGQDFVAWDTMYGKIRVHKVSSSPSNTKDASVYSLTGTTFSVYNSAGTKVDTLTVKSNGYSEYTGSLKAGKYTLKETAAGKGYKKSTLTYSATITGSQGDIVAVTKEISNTPNTGTANIVKTSDSGVVSGFKFRIKNDAIGYNKVFTTTSTGKITTTLYYGTYTVTEELTAAQKEAGYKEQAPQTFKLSDTDKTKTLNVHNTISQSAVKIYKRSNTGEVLGFEFHVTDKSTNKTEIYFTEKTEVVNGETLGVIELKLKPGTYEIFERLDPKQLDAGWLCTENTKTLTVNAGKQASVTFENTFTPKHDPIRIFKSTSDNGKSEGFRFKIEGLHNNSIDITEKDILEGAELKTIGLSEYDLGNWQADGKTIAKVNESAKAGDVGNTFKIKAVNSGSYKAKVPKNVSVSTSDESAKISWDTILGESYEIYRCEAAEEDGELTEGEYEKLADTDKASYTDDTIDMSKPGYFYKVKSKAGAAESGFSQTKAVTISPDGEITVTDGKAAAKDKNDIGLEAEITLTLDNVIKDENLNVSSKAEASDKRTDKAQDFELEYNHAVKWYGSATKFTGESITDRYGKITTEELETGTYTVTELMTDEQKLRYENSEPQTVEALEEGSSVSVFFENTAKTSPLTIIKKSPDDNVDGITFKIEGTTLWGDNVSLLLETEQKTAADGSVYGFLDTELAPGSYTVTEIIDEVKYVAQPPQSFEVTGDKDEEIELTFNNVPYGDIEITKIAKDTGKPLPGAVLQVLEKDEDGEYNLIDEWVSDENPHKVSGLVTGNTYTLREEEAPDGYICAPDKEFTAELSKDGEPMKVEMQDSPTTLYITKTDEKTGEYLDGAEFTISDKETGEALVKFVIKKDENGNAIAEITELNDSADENITAGKTEEESFIEKLKSLFASKDAEEEFDESLYAKINGLFEDKEYVLSETNAPEGYTPIDDMTFTFLEELSLDIDNARPEIGTTALDSDTNDHLSNADKEVTIIDTVEYQNLETGKTYTVTGTLMDKETGEPITDEDGNPVTATSEFTAQEHDGSVDISFTFDGSLLAGKTVVAFESLTLEEKEIAVHADINDEGQTVHMPAIHTTAKADGAKEISPNGTVTITDEVFYSNLMPGKEYEIKGTLMDKETGKPIKDKSGSEVTMYKKFTALTETGSIKADVKINSDTLAGKDIVVFEEVYFRGTLVGARQDIKDIGQTVRIYPIGRIDINDDDILGSILSRIAKTGDNSKVMLFAALIAAAALTAGFIFAGVRRKEEEPDKNE